MSNREYATLIIVIIFIITCVLFGIKNKGNRLNLVNFFKSIKHLFKHHISKLILFYSLLVLFMFILILINLDLDLLLFVDFIVFSLFTFYPTFKFMFKGVGGSLYYKLYFQDTFNSAALGGVLLSIYTFNIWIELLLIVPVLLFLGIFKAFAELDKKNKSLVKLLEYIMMLIGFIILANMFIGIVKGFNEWFTLDFWIPIFILIIGILFYVPLIYVLPTFFILEKRIYYYEKWKDIEYYKRFIYIKINQFKMGKKPKVTNFKATNIEVAKHSFKPCYVDILISKNIENITSDIITFIEELKLGIYTIKDKDSDNDIPIYADYIEIKAFIESVEGNKEFVSTYRWQNPRLKEQWLKNNKGWSSIGNNIFMNKVENSN